VSVCHFEQSYWVWVEDFLSISHGIMIGHDKAIMHARKNKENCECLSEILNQ
jgi:hypothetical protein